MASTMGKMLTNFEKENILAMICGLCFNTNVVVQNCFANVHKEQLSVRFGVFGKVEGKGKENSR